MYNFEEGIFDLPIGWTDRSIHLFDRQIEGAAITLMITRDVVPAELTVDTAATEFLSNIEPRVRRFELVARGHDKSFGAPTMRVYYRYFHAEHGQATVLQLMVRWEDRLLTMAMTGPTRAEQQMTRSFEAMFKTLKLRRRTLSGAKEMPT